MVRKPLACQPRRRSPDFQIRCRGDSGKYWRDGNWFPFIVACRMPLEDGSTGLILNGAAGAVSLHLIDGVRIAPVILAFFRAATNHRHGYRSGRPRAHNADLPDGRLGGQQGRKGNAERPVPFSRRNFLQSDPGWPRQKERFRNRQHRGQTIFPGCNSSTSAETPLRRGFSWVRQA
jgi:hypothetical protein